MKDSRWNAQRKKDSRWNAQSMKDSRWNAQSMKDSRWNAQSITNICCLLSTCIIPAHWQVFEHDTYVVMCARFCTCVYQVLQNYSL